jgi:hypothetical protein
MAGCRRMVDAWNRQASYVQWALSALQNTSEVIVNTEHILYTIVVYNSHRKSGPHETMQAACGLDN